MKAYHGCRLASRHLRTAYLLCCCMIGLPAFEMNAAELTFDRLFPATVYSMILDSCMKVWGSFRALQTIEHDADQLPIIRESLLKDLLAFEATVRKGLSLQKPQQSICSEDLGYLASVIDHICDECSDALADIGIAYTILLGIKVYLEHAKLFANAR